MYFLSHSQFEDYVYNLENVVDDTYCIIVEGPFDLMILTQLGYKNVISTLSTRVSEKHLQHIIPFKKIIFCFDDDKESKAGQTAVMKTANLILDISPQKQLYYCRLPEGKDPTEATEAELKAAFNKLIMIRKKTK
jgi:DNA primase